MKKNLFSPAIVFIIGLLALGIGNSVNIYLISDRFTLDGSGRVMYPMREAVLNFITFGVYGIFWTYRTAKNVDLRFGVSSNAFPVLAAVLSALPLRCVSMALITNKLLLSEKD